ncbi:hypothetical protein Acor_20790 [Acrocarpospora corrugata]|uniref:Uncharacterized protein n=1 Tax=Acrocarpospora corrugata TaxID=35763 RepID=A0A5M3VTW6_9ACTN|nr:hypothetical protein Acor_20790 [Acrocarpospora corrugata]
MAFLAEVLQVHISPELFCSPWEGKLNGLIGVVSEAFQDGGRGEGAAGAHGDQGGAGV